MESEEQPEITIVEHVREVGVVSNDEVLEVVDGEDAVLDASVHGVDSDDLGHQTAQPGWIDEIHVFQIVVRIIVMQNCP